MADSVITPAAQVPTVVAAGGQQTQSATDATTKPPGLPAGTLVSGTITGKDTDGSFLLKSAQGTFALKSDTPLTYNSDVTIRVGASNSQGSNATRIVTVNGEPYAAFTAPEPEISDSVSPALLTQSTGVDTADNAPAPPIRATVVATPLSTAQQSVNAALTPGNIVSLRVTPQAAEPANTAPAVPAPSTAAQNAVATVTGNQAVQAAPEATPALADAAQQAPAVTAFAAAAAPASNTANALPASSAPPTTASGNVVAPAAAQSATSAAPASAQGTTPQVVQQSTATPVSVLYNAYAKQSALPAAPAAVSAPADAPIAAPATAAAAPQIQAAPLAAQVTSAAANGTVELQTPLGAVTVQAGVTPALASLTAGTALTLELATAELTQPLNTPPAAGIAELAASWQSLKDIADVEETQSPASAGAGSTGGTGLLARLPQLGPGFVGQSLGFIASLLQGDTEQLLGEDTVQSIKRGGRQDLLDKFSAESAGVAEAYNAPAQKQQAGWQPLFLPFVFQEGLQQARIYVKREAPRKDRDGARTNPDTRFVVEVDMSELGGVQMDGLVRKKEAATAFDLVVRSHNAFSAEDQHAMLEIYNEAAELTGFKGSIAFQVTRDFPVKPLEETEEGRDITV